MEVLKFLLLLPDIQIEEILEESIYEDFPGGGGGEDILLKLPPMFGFTG